MPHRFKKIDCVMLQVDDLEKAIQFYTRVFGLQPLWRDENAVALLMEESDTEIVLYTNLDIPENIHVHFLVDDVPTAVSEYLNNGCTLVAAPFDIPIGKCAIVEDPFGHQLAVLDMSKGPRTTGS